MINHVVIWYYKLLVPNSPNSIITKSSSVRLYYNECTSSILGRYIHWGIRVNDKVFSSRFHITF